MPRRTRATALAAVAAACALALPLAVSCAGQDDGRRHASTGPDDLRPVFAPEGRNPEKGASEERAAASGERAAERRDSGDGATPARTPEPDQAPPGTPEQEASLKVGRLADGTQPIAQPPRD